MKNVGGDLILPAELDEEVQKAGAALNFPGFNRFNHDKDSSKEEITEEPDKKRKIIRFPLQTVDEVLPVIKEEKKPNKNHINTIGLRAKTHMISKLSKEDTKPITFELDAVQQRRMKMEGKYDILERAKQLDIVPKSKEFPFSGKGTPDSKKLLPLLGLFFTEAWWNMTEKEKKNCGYKKEKGLTNKVIKKYFVKMMHEGDEEKFRDPKFNITNNMNALIDKIHNNVLRGKRPIPGLLDMDKSDRFVKLTPHKSLKSLGFDNLIKLLWSTEEKGLTRKQVTYLMAGGKRKSNKDLNPGTKNLKPGSSEEIVPPVGEDDILDIDDALENMEASDEIKASSIQVHGVSVKIVKYPDGRVEMEFKL